MITTESLTTRGYDGTKGRLHEFMRGRLREGMTFKLHERIASLLASLAMMVASSLRRRYV